MTTITSNSTSFCFNNYQQPQLLSNQSSNQQDLLWQNIFNSFQQIQNCNPNHNNVSFNEFLHSLPNIYNSVNNQQQQQINIVNKRNSNKNKNKKPSLRVIDEDNELLTSPKSKLPIVNQKESLNVSAPVFIPSSLKIQQNTTNNNNIYNKFKQFIPTHKARAKLNIYIAKQITKKLLTIINEPFPNINALYYYLDISTALQINDKQINLFKNNNNNELGIINFDLHSKQTNELLYAIILPNHSSKIESNKWLWKLDKFLTANEIFAKYNINMNQLPKSSRLLTNGINDQLIKQFYILNNSSINTNILFSVNWNNINQLGSPIKVKKTKKSKKSSIATYVKAELNNTLFVNECIKSWNFSTLIPIIVYENSDINNSKHWIEWIKLIYIEQYNSYIGISFKYNNNNNNNTNNWQIGSIYLDKGDMLNKHRLFGPNNNIISANQSYNKYFDTFHTSITQLLFV